MSAGVLLIVGFIAPLLVVAIIGFPQFGVIVLLLMAYLLFAIMKLSIDFPLGTLMDGLQWLLIIGFFVHQKKETETSP